MDDVPAHDDWLTAPEAERLEGFNFTKRREEARLGRWTAKRAVADALRLDAEPDTLRGLVIRNAPDGAPEVLVDGAHAPMRISMTDRADWAVCVVLAGSQEVGCDLELVEGRSAGFVTDWFTAAEQDHVANTTIEWDLVTNLIWSAKESALKVLRTGLRRDTRSVEVTIAEPVADDSWSSLFVQTSEGLTLTGWWHRFGDFVFTYVSESITHPPRSLVEPSGLRGAIPSHRWMAEPRRPPRG